MNRIESREEAEGHAFKQREQHVQSSVGMKDMIGAELDREVIVLDDLRG